MSLLPDRRHDPRRRLSGRLLLLGALLVGLVHPAIGSAAVQLPLPSSELSCGQLLPLEGGDGRLLGCTHGPDPAPPGVDPSVPWPARLEQPVPATARALPPAVLPCYPDGSSGARVQAIYAVPAGTPDRYSSVAPSIARWAAEADQVVAESAKQTGGTRHVRYVTDGNCGLVIQKVELSAAGDDTFTNTMTELTAMGFNRPDRKYLVWMDSTVLCGIAGFYYDDRPGQDNANNSVAPGQVGRIDSGCWGLASRGQSVEAHELLHNLGGVQPSAPHATQFGHCDDDADRMCYADGSPGLVLRNVCPASQEALLDCNNDDYFSTSPPAGSYLATRWNTARSSFLATEEPPQSQAVVAPPQPPAPPPSSPSPAPILTLPRLPDPGRVGTTPSRFTALTPARIFDTRTGDGGRTGKLGPGSSYDVTVIGRGGVPTQDVGGVLLNVTVTQPTAAGDVTVYPTGADQPAAPNVVFRAGQTRPNLVVVPVGTNGQVRFANRAGSAHLLADVVGWFDRGNNSAQARFSSLAPARILDTRTGVGAPRTRLGAAQTLSLQATGRGGVPSSGVSAVVMNVTVTNPTTSSYLTLYPSGRSRPLASQLNFVPQQTVPNLVVVATGSTGKVDIFNAGGQTHVIADVVGWLDNGSNAAQSAYDPVTPQPLLDTRDGTGGRDTPLGPGEVQEVQVTGQGGVPSSGVAGVTLNVSALDPTSAGYLTVYPTGTERPTASSLNFTAGQSTANVVVVPVGPDGRINVFNPSGRTHVRMDAVGYFNES